MEHHNAKKAIRLLPSHKYDTYQLFSVMGNANTPVSDGLKIGALTCVQWLFDRLEGNQIPKELVSLKDADYRKLRDDQLQSFSINNGYTLDVQSNPQQGFWALRIIEPDLGDAGNDSSQCNPIAGRVIETNIAFTVVANRLQCGFKTSISDLQDQPEADCYRFAIIKKLWQNYAFQLKHIIDLDNTKLPRIDDENELRKLNELLQNHANQLPVLLCIDPATSQSHLVELMMKPMPRLLTPRPDFSKLTATDTKPADVSEIKPAESNPFSYTQKTLSGYAHCFVISHSCAEQLLKKHCFSIKDKDRYILIEPIRNGGKLTQLTAFDEPQLAELKNYSREKVIDYHDILFFNDARYKDWQIKEDIKEKQREELQNTRMQNGILQNQAQRNQRIETHDGQDSIESKNQEIRRLKEKALDMEERMLKQMFDCEQENKRLKKQLSDNELLIAYYRRKEQRPKEHCSVIDWSENLFQRVVFDDKAKKMMQANGATRVPLDTICDALDYLGTLYCSVLFDNVDEEQAKLLCAAIYNRPYDVSPSGYDESDNSDRKIRYQYSGDRKREVPLNMHLKIGGNGDDDLLRIYFLIDQKRQQIVIGSLPNHL